MKLVFATHNEHKFEEVKKLLPDYIELVSLKEIGCTEDIEETGSTLEENAQIKADYIYKHYELSCFSDDTGLLVDALNGAPGVYSARYAGEQKDAQDNMNKLLIELRDKKDRTARFETVIALNIKGVHHFFKGRVYGEITEQKSGNKGFGYDPIFKPDGYDATFGELALNIKNGISHRARAIEQLVAFLHTLSSTK